MCSGSCCRQGFDDASEIGNHIHHSNRADAKVWEIGWQLTLNGDASDAALW
jgi:hypothetical protein